MLTFRLTLLNCLNKMIIHLWGMGFLILMDGYTVKKRTACQTQLKALAAELIGLVDPGGTELDCVTDSSLFRLMSLVRQWH